MAIYKAKRFNQNTKKLGITDDVLLKAAEDIKQGVWEANLGGGVIKKRLPLQQGKSGGARTVIFFKYDRHIFFYDGWAKNSVSSGNGKEIEDDELIAYRKLASAFLAFTDTDIAKLLATGFLVEVDK
ncbi:type II toxin-antitoxin system RelE/ParE family toxin [Kluyvera sichuanensis]|uniref:type II toxin-antitoxin system RelE/ParE family toxin n=1 Tax=Kluyvera sichuanensis TaxID=2725494 RepID=UPI0034A0E5B4